MSPSNNTDDGLAASGNDKNKGNGTVGRETSGTSTHHHEGEKSSYEPAGISTDLVGNDYLEDVSSRHRADLAAVRALQSDKTVKKAMDVLMGYIGKRRDVFSVRLVWITILRRFFGRENPDEAPSHIAQETVDTVVDTIDRVKGFKAGTTDRGAWRFCALLYLSADDKAQDSGSAEGIQWVHCVDFLEYLRPGNAIDLALRLTDLSTGTREIPGSEPKPFK